MTKPEPSATPVEMNLDGLHAGDVVLVDGVHFEIVSLEIRERVMHRGDATGPQGLDPTRLDFELAVADWLNPEYRSPDAPPPPDSPVVIDWKRALPTQALMLNGQAYMLYKFDHVADGLGEIRHIKLSVERAWWRDPGKRLDHSPATSLHSPVSRSSSHVRRQSQV